MITLVVNEGKVFVWDATDWLTLREEYRIVGELVGCLAFLPRQESFPGLPLALLPEEVTLLVEQGVVKIVHNISFKAKPTEHLIKEFKEYREKLQADQIEQYMAERKQQVKGKIDQIIEGKRRKLSGQTNSKRAKKRASSATEKLPIADDAFDHETIIQEELAKTSPLDENSVVGQIFTAHPWKTRANEQPFAWVYPETGPQKVRYQIFKSLWEKGYYITSGHKFGVDFLIYPGDPIKFHAHFLVVCLDTDAPLPVLELVALGRLGTSVRKTVVLASCSDHGESVSFQSVTWSGAAR